MVADLIVTNAQIRNISHSRNQSRNELGLQSSVQTVAGVIAFHIAANILVEQHGVSDLIGVETIAADLGVQVQADVLIHDTEGNGAGGTKLVVQDLLQVEVVNTLILCSIATKGETTLQSIPAVLDALAQAAIENGGLGGCVPGKFTGFCGEFNNSTLVHDHHTLAFINNNNAAVGDDVIGASGVAGLAANSLGALSDQNILRQSVAVEVFLPLVAQNAAGRIQCCFNKSHNSFLLLS